MAKSFQVTLNSRNVLVPMALEDARGERVNGPLSRMDTATAMVIRVEAGGGFMQEFLPLRVGSDSILAYAGQEWELWAQKTGAGWYAYYVGVPDRVFAAGPGGPGPKSISVQVVGTSPLTGREDFSGGVDITLQAEVDLPLIPGFLNLGERFFPTLLPHNFIESYALDAFEFQGKRRLVLMVSVQSDPADRPPVSLGKHWDAKNWIEAVVENLAPARSGGAAGCRYFTIAGGCFYARDRKITHWFGGRIGLEEKSFRAAAADKIRAMGSSGQGAWVFWLEPQGGEAPDLEGLERAGHPHIAVRHAVLHQLLSGTAGRTVGRLPLSIANLPPAAAMTALGGVARILVEFQGVLQRAKAEPSHALWTQTADAAPGGLAAHIRALYRSQGEALRILETVFDEAHGYAAWDAVDDPWRASLSAYLAEAKSP